METITKVQFRKLRGEIVAVFPYDIETQETTGCYCHIGQHSTCDWFINTYTKPVTPEEYKDLFEELTSIGYNLQVIKRRSHQEYLTAYHTFNQRRQK